MLGDNALATILAAAIGAIPPTIIAVAVWTSTRRTRKALGVHVEDEGYTSEAIMSVLGKLAEAAGVDEAAKGGA